MKLYTDEARGYDGLENRESVTHSAGEYVRGMAHVNGVESFWATLKRAHKGVYPGSCDRRRGAGPGRVAAAGDGIVET